ncbi:MAG TPA: AAA family ATPase [Candidatus Dormibacteraeota bacterium]|jgi:predicted kinase|nr:AAA family ATPase [Candidatus Dormibacteraeota bacterium]
MSALRAPIWLITGVPGSGKTSVCGELASRYVSGVHLETDLMDEEGLHRYGEMDRPIERLLFRRGVALMAAEFAMSGVAVVIDDTLESDEERRAYTDRLRGVRLVHLLPPLEVALTRNASRTNKPEGDAPMLDRTARRLYPRMRVEHTERRGWHVFDPSALDPRETVDALIERFGLEDLSD